MNLARHTARIEAMTMLAWRVPGCQSPAWLVPCAELLSSARRGKPSAPIAPPWIARGGYERLACVLVLTSTHSDSFVVVPGIYLMTSGFFL